jgi:hypothetical protein
MSCERVMLYLHLPEEKVIPTESVFLAALVTEMTGLVTLSIGALNIYLNIFDVVLSWAFQIR